MEAAQRKISLLELRQQIGAIDGRVPREVYKFDYLQQPLPKGSVVEFAGTGKTELILHFLKEHPTLSVAWVESRFSLNPYALLQKQVNFESLIFIEGGRDAHWALHQLLQSQAFDLVISGDLNLEENEMRRFKLLSEKAKTTLFLLADKMHTSWVQTVQVQTRRNAWGQLQAQVVKKRMSE
jgi:hypothetical protein